MRDSFVICDTCKVYQANGLLDGANWMDYHYTAASFDEEAAGLSKMGAVEPQIQLLPQNNKIRAFLGRHPHKISYTSSAWYMGAILGNLKEEK